MTGTSTGSDASDHSDPVLFLCFGKVAVWFAIGTIVWGVAVLCGIVIARGIELALGAVS